MSIPTIIGIVAVGLILIGLVILLWRWRMRVRQIARMNREFQGSYEKYGVGRGIESSNSSGSAKSKLDPYGSFFEVETEKPKKALLNFRRASSSQTSHGGHGPPPGKPVTTPGWVASSTFAPPSVNMGPANKKAGAPAATVGPGSSGSGWGSQQTAAPAYTQKPPGSAQGPMSPPGLKQGSSRRSSFAFSLRKSVDAKPPKVQHLPSNIKSKGISAPLIVANGGAEPWSPLPTPDPPSSFAAAAESSSSEKKASSKTDLSNSTTISFPQPPPPVASTIQPQKFKQPQPRSPPATPGTSQKLKHDMLTPANYVPTVFSGHSDGSLYSRNSFSNSSDHDHHQSQLVQQMSQLPLPPPPLPLPPAPASTAASPTANAVTGAAATSPPGASTSLGSIDNGGAGGAGSGSGVITAGGVSMGTTGQPRGKPGKGAHNPYPSSSYTYSPQQQSIDGSEIARPGSANSQYRSGMPRLMTVIAPFTPTLEDELPLKIGDTVRIIEEYRDAWCLVQLVGRIDSPRGVVPCVCLQERKRIVPVPVNVGPSGSHHKHSESNSSQWR